MHKKAINAKNRRSQTWCWRVSYVAALVGHAAHVVLQTILEKGGVVGIDMSGGEPATECSKQSERGGVW